MKFIIPFDEKIFLNQTEISIPYVFSDSLKKVKQSLFVSLISTLMGVILLVNKSSLGYFFIVSGFSFLINSYFKYDLYKNLKIKYLEITKQKLIENKGVIKEGIFNITKDYLNYSDVKSNRKIKWSEFNGYKITKDNLLLFIEPLDGDIMVISKSEIGKNQFKQLIELTKQNLK